MNRSTWTAILAAFVGRCFVCRSGSHLLEPLPEIPADSNWTSPPTATSK
jgi:hypothetical protein